jgi:hypothetical protein
MKELQLYRVELDYNKLQGGLAATDETRDQSLKLSSLQVPNYAASFRLRIVNRECFLTNVGFRVFRRNLQIGQTYEFLLPTNIYIRKLIQVPFMVISRQTEYAAKSFALLRRFYVPLEAVNLHKGRC